MIPRRKRDSDFYRCWLIEYTECLHHESHSREEEEPLKQFNINDHISIVYFKKPHNIILQCVDGFEEVWMRRDFFNFLALIAAKFDNQIGRLFTKNKSS